MVEIRGDETGLIDEPLALSARGAGEAPLWRARVTDDDGRVWRASAARPQELAAAWGPAKESTGPVAALQSLRPVRLDVRAESAEGPAANRTFERRLLGEGVKLRRWRDGALQAALLVPAVPAEPAADSLVVDATAGEAAAAAATLAAALLASRGLLVLVVAPGRGSADPGALVDAARERLADVPSASGRSITLLRADEIGLPPGIPARDTSDPAAWDALLARLGARPRSPSDD